MPRVEELLEVMRAARVFSTLDLKKSYYQVMVATKNVHKTAFCMEWGKYEFAVMSFGLRNAPASFQRLMDIVLYPDREVLY